MTNLPEEIVKHIITKSETSLVESFNSRLRHYIASLKRRGFCYAKSEKTLEMDVFFLMKRKQLRKYL